MELKDAEEEKLHGAALRACTDARQPATREWSGAELGPVSKREQQSVVAVRHSMTLISCKSC